MDNFERISVNPAVMGGKPCIRGMLVTVSMIVSQIASGQSVESLLEDFPYIEREDITQALRYAESHNYLVLTRDMDFSALLATSKGNKPSVIQLRAENVSPETMLRPVVDAINTHGLEIENGTVITIDIFRTRVHILPFKTRS